MTPEQAASAETLRCAINRDLSPRPDISPEDIANVLAALDAVQAAAQAIDDELVTIESTLSTYPTPRDAVRELIDWHVAVALDPAVSSDAQALIDRGAAAQAPSAQTFDAVWPSLVIPGEFDGMDQCDQSRWRGVLEQAFNLGRAAQAPRVRELCGVAP